MRPITIILAGLVVLAGCTSRGDTNPRSSTILTPGASEVIAQEGTNSDKLICRKQRLPGSYRMRRICQSTAEYEAEVASNRAALESARSGPTACTSECGISSNGGN